MKIFSILNSFLIVLFIFLSFMTMSSMAMGLAMAPAGKSGFSVLVFYAFGIILHEVMFLLAMIPLISVFYIFLFRKLSSRSLLLYAIYYYNWIFLSATIAYHIVLAIGLFVLVNIYGKLIFLGILAIIICLVRLIFHFKYQDMWKHVVSIPERLKNKAQGIVKSAAHV